MNEELGYQREREEENPRGKARWSGASVASGTEASLPPRRDRRRGRASGESCSRGGGCPGGSEPEAVPEPFPNAPGPVPDATEMPPVTPAEPPTPDAELSDEEWEDPWQSRQRSPRGGAPETAEEGLEVTPMPPNLTARRRGTLSKPKRRSQVTAVPAAEAPAAGYLAAQRAAGPRLRRAGRRLPPHALRVEEDVSRSWARPG